MAAAMSDARWRLVIHGGAGSMRPQRLSAEAERCARDGLEAALSAGDLADRVGISRPTAQRYLTHLLKAGLVERELQYGATGRASHRYRAR